MGVKLSFYRLIKHAFSFPKDKRKTPLVDIGWSLPIAQWHIYFSTQKIFYLLDPPLSVDPGYKEPKKIARHEPNSRNLNNAVSTLGTAYK